MQRNDIDLSTSLGMYLWLEHKIMFWFVLFDAEVGSIGWNTENCVVMKQIFIGYSLSDIRSYMLSTHKKNENKA